MLSEEIEGKWIDAFAETFALSKIKPGEPVAILSESLSRRVNVRLSELALLRIGARPFHVTVPSPPHSGPIPYRASGTVDVIRGLEPVINALKSAPMMIDVTLETIFYSSALPEILKAGVRILVINDEHPEILERVKPDPAYEPKVKLGMRMLERAKQMRVTSAAGTDLVVDLAGTPAEGTWGFVTEPGQISGWPAGMCLCFPKAGSVNGTVVVNKGDINLTFKRYLENPITLRLENDYVVAIEGDHADGDLFRSYIAGTGQKEAYATSHVGWGMNPKARWDAMTLYDRGDFIGTEFRVFAGNFLFSTGANWAAGRHTNGHFDLPMKDCTITLDNQVIVDRGRLQGDLAY
jgi:2,5-dihydroxypyridine 5,6-dioxygenase